MQLDEYDIRRREFAARGMALPHSKLTPLEVGAIRQAAWKRKDLIEYIREELSNDALAKQFGVHRRTIEKVLSLESWSHV